MQKTAMILGISLIAGSVQAAQTNSGSCTAMSGKTANALLELYTSEGCSSCPPADEWLARFRASKLYPDRVVPLALHVDYWNYLGWEDPFSDKRHTQRQYSVARRHRSRTVYTPQLLLNGKEFLHWRHRGMTAVESAIMTPARADLTLTLEREGNVLNITVKARAAERGVPDLFIVLYENDLTNHVRAGENEGRTLRHDFVARRWLGPKPLSDDGTVHVTQRLELDRTWKVNDLGVAAFVQDRDNGEVWQVLARPLCS